jgi:hypothetical protein
MYHRYNQFKIHINIKLSIRLDLGHNNGSEKKKRTEAFSSD